LEAAIGPWLVEAEADLKARIEQMRFDE
jgi:hypothetical protein